MTQLDSNLDEWREAGTWLDFRGHRIFVTEKGKGTPILVLHGFPIASYDYARLSPLLEKDYRLIYFDFLGYGFSDKPQHHPYSLFEQADITQHVAQHFGFDSVNILTHDMGNSVTLEILKRGTPIVENLVMLNGSVLLDYYRPLITQKLLLHPVIGPLVSRFRLIRKPMFARQFGKIFAQQPPSEEIDAFWKLIGYNDGMANYHLLIRYLNERLVHQHTWLEALETHTAPLTVVWGQLDPVAVPKIAEEGILKRRTDTTYIPLHDIGHFPQWEAPQHIADAVRQAIH